MAKEAEGVPVDEEAYDALEEPDEADAEQTAKLLEDEEEARVVNGRLSPHAKEDMYRLYLQGWTVKDLSEKYGILTARVKAVLWLRRYFHEEIMPHTDRPTWRKSIEIDFEEAAVTPFNDYGLDLDTMAIESRGVERYYFTRQHYDTLLEEPAADLGEDVKTGIKYYFAERSVIGSGKKGYRIKDMVVHRGSGRHTVSEMFKQVCMQGDKAPHKLPKKVRKALNLGPRIASLGYRMGGNNRRG
jgi:hypothetical protein